MTVLDELCSNSCGLGFDYQVQSRFCFLKDETMRNASLDWNSKGVGTFTRFFKKSGKNCSRVIT